MKIYHTITITSVIVFSLLLAADACGRDGDGAIANNSVDLVRPPVPADSSHSPPDRDKAHGETPAIVDQAPAPVPASAAPPDLATDDVQVAQLDSPATSARSLHELGSRPELIFAIPERERRPIGQSPGEARMESRGSPALEYASPDAKHWWSALDPRTSDLTRVIGATVIVIGLIILTRIVIQRAGRSFFAARRPSGVVEILARYPMGRNEQILLLKLVRRVILLHRCGSNVTVLTELADPDEVAMLLARVEAGSGSPAGADFRSTLDRLALEPTVGSRRSGSRVEPAARAGVEFIDLTRTTRRGANRLLGVIRGTS